MAFARNPGGERADEAGWPWSHRRAFLEDSTRKATRRARAANTDR